MVSIEVRPWQAVQRCLIGDVPRGMTRSIVLDVDIGP